MIGRHLRLQIKVIKQPCRTFLKPIIAKSSSSYKNE